MLSGFFSFLYFCYHFYIFFSFSKIFFLSVSLVACLSAKSTNSLKESRKGFKFKIEIIKKNDGKQSIKRGWGVSNRGWKGAKAQNFQKMRRQKFLFEYSRIILMRGKKVKKKSILTKFQKASEFKKKGKKITIFFFFFSSRENRR